MLVSVINSLASEAARQNPVCVTLHRVKGKVPLFLAYRPDPDRTICGKLNDAFWDKVAMSATTVERLFLAKTGGPSFVHAMAPYSSVAKW